MITAKDARRKTNYYLNSRDKIEKILDNISLRIQKDCEKGMSQIFVSINEFENLSPALIHDLLFEIKTNGYKVEPLYDELNEIAGNCLTAYKIEW